MSLDNLAAIATLSLGNLFRKMAIWISCTLDGVSVGIIPKTSKFWVISFWDGGILNQEVSVNMVAETSSTVYSIMILYKWLFQLGICFHVATWCWRIARAD
jgi:hypothetical protein